MGEDGCLRDGKFNNLECNNMVNHGVLLSHQNDFNSGTSHSIEDATRGVFTIANGAAGQTAGATGAATAHTLLANAISAFNGDSSAAHALHLPPAILDTFVLLHLTGDMDEANAFKIHTNIATDTFAKHYIEIKHADNGGTDGAPTQTGVQTLGTHSTPTSITLTYTPAATATNFLSINSEIHFYCAKAGQWTIKIYGVAEGVGSTGSVATTA